LVNWGRPVGGGGQPDLPASGHRHRHAPQGFPPWGMPKGRLLRRGIVIAKCVGCAAGLGNPEPAVVRKKSGGKAGPSSTTRNKTRLSYEWSVSKVCWQDKENKDLPRNGR